MDILLIVSVIILDIVLVTLLVTLIYFSFRTKTLIEKIDRFFTQGIGLVEEEIRPFFKKLSEDGNWYGKSLEKSITSFINSNMIDKLIISLSKQVGLFLFKKGTKGIFSLFKRR